MDIKIKTCNKCGFTGDLSFFKRGNVCKKCLKKQEIERINSQKNKNKTCNKCGFTGDSSLFGRGNVCKKCLRKQDIDRTNSQKNKDKTCSKCGFVGISNLFISDKNICKECARKQKEQRSKAQENKIKTCSNCGFIGLSYLFSTGNVCKKCIKKQNQARKENEKDKIKTCSKCGFIGENRLFKSSSNICKKCHNESDKKLKMNKYKNDPSYKIMVICSVLIRDMLKKQNSSKNGESCKCYLKFTGDMLCKHIEKQFLLSENLDNNGNIWMNWNNQGKYNPETWNDNDSSTWVWQLDHYIPKSKLEYFSMDDLNFKICWHLRNLRPLSAKINNQDGNRRNPDEINKLKEIIIKKLEKEELEKCERSDLASLAATIL